MVCDFPGVSTDEVRHLFQRRLARKRRGWLVDATWLFRSASTTFGSLLLAIATAVAPPSLGRVTSWDQPRHVPAVFFSASFLAVANLKFPRCLLICGCGRRATVAINFKRCTPSSICPCTTGSIFGLAVGSKSRPAAKARPSAIARGKNEVYDHRGELGEPFASDPSFPKFEKQ